MKIESLKELESLVKMCNKHGVHSITIDGISMTISKPDEQLKANSGNEVATPDQYSQEDVLFWSSGAADVG